MPEDTSDASSSSSSSTNEGISHAQPREHSYLEESHPLLPETDPGALPISSSNSNSSSSNGDSTLELVVLELHGVVLFPGCTIPVKLRNRSVIRYLGKQIRLCRKDPSAQPVVRFGILPFAENEQLHEHEQGSGLGQWERERYSSSQRQSRNSRRDRILAGLRPRNPSFGGNSFGNSFAARRQTTGNNNANNTNTGGFSYASRRGLTRTTDEFGRNSDGDDNIDDNIDDNSDANSNRNRGDQPEVQEEDVHPLVGRIGTIATVKHTHERTGSGGNGDGHGNDSGNANADGDGDASSSSSWLWDRYEDATELVLTAVGTSRFRIVSFVESGPTDKLFEVEELRDEPLPRPSVPGRSLPMGKRARESQSESKSNPGSKSDSEGDREREREREFQPRSTRMRTPTDTLAWNLSLLTPIPYFVHQKWTPWSLVEKIVKTLTSPRGRLILPSLGGGDSIVASGEKLEPISFAYWMANNAPFSEDEKRELLSTNSVLERLLLEWNKVREWTDAHTESDLCCVNCGTRLAKASRIFAVDGAEGTTSAYVNRQGFIHQVITLRTVDRDKIFLQGGPRTENSYFPGYCWTIAHCESCSSLLGWRFDKKRTMPYLCRMPVLRSIMYGYDDIDDSDYDYDSDSDDRDTVDRPRRFYGFLSSNIKLKTRTFSQPPMEESFGVIDPETR